jgi:hypothetical protein
LESALGISGSLGVSLGIIQEFRKNLDFQIPAFCIDCHSGGLTDLGSGITVFSSFTSAFIPDYSATSQFSVL